MTVTITVLHIHIPYSTECDEIITAGTTDNPKHGVWRDHHCRDDGQSQTRCVARSSSTAGTTVKLKHGVYVGGTFEDSK